MVNYSCKRCGFNTNIRTKYYDHLRKKNTCKTLLSEVSIEYLKQELDVYIASKNKIEIDPKSYSLLPHNLLTNPSQIYSQNIQNGTMSSFNGTMSSFNGTMSSSNESMSSSNGTMSSSNGNMSSSNGNMSSSNESMSSSSESMSSSNGTMSSSNGTMSSSRKDTLPSKYKCHNCNAIFSRKDNLKRHLRLYCKYVKGTNIEDYMGMNINNGTINNTTDNSVKHCTITNNITINNYGKEKIDHILKDTQFINSLLKGPYTAIPRMIEAIHFDRDHPENMNVRIQNKKEPWILVFKGGKWMHERKKEVLDDIIDKSYASLDLEYPQNKGKLNDVETERYSHFQTKMDDKDDVLIKNMRQDAEKVILNNRENI